MAWWAAVAQLAGDVTSAWMSSTSAHNQNRMALRLAREQMAFQERMSNTAHQREVKDLRAAGLNPILSATGGQGASSPAGASAPVVSEFPAAAADAVRGAGGAVAKLIELKYTAAQTKKTEAEAKKTEAEAQLVEAQVPWSAGNAAIQAKNLSTQRSILIEQLDQQLIKTDFDKLNKEQFERLAPIALEMQKYLTQAEKLGLSEKEATSEFWQKLPEAKFAEFLKYLLIILKEARR